MVFNLKKNLKKKTIILGYESLTGVGQICILKIDQKACLKHRILTYGKVVQSGIVRVDVKNIGSIFGMVSY